MGINFDQTTLQNAIDNAADGATIYGNAGSWQWDVGVYLGTEVTASSKSIRLIGAGGMNGLTTITFNCAGNGLAIFLQKPATFKIASIQFRRKIGMTNMIYCGMNVADGYPEVGFIARDLYMQGDPDAPTGDRGRFIMVGAMYGLVRDSYFESLTESGAGNISMSPDNAVSTSNSYHTPQTFGDENALYMERCEFKFAIGNQSNGAIDMYAGSKYVFRNCIVWNNNIGNHGWDSGQRGTRSFEIYRNTFIATSHVTGINLFGPRSGTGPIWNNTVKNQQPMNAGEGYEDFFTPRYYGAITPAGLNGNINLNARAAGYYPSADWGDLPYPGTSGPVIDGRNNYVTGSNPIDGNQQPPGHMDAAYTRTVTDMVSDGSNTITSNDINFVNGDLPKLIFGTNIARSRTVVDGVVTSGDATVTSATANFNAGDVGRTIGTEWTGYLPHDTTIVSINSSTSVEVSVIPANGDSGLMLSIPGAFIASITDEHTAVLNCNVAAGSGQTLTIGYTDEGYPLADQPGRGSFAIANAGNWPNVTTGYTDANYEALDPTFLWGNHWQTVDADFNVLTDTVPPASAVGLDGGQPYMKHLREWYDDPDCTVGLLAALPGTCAVNDLYFATDDGSQGALYRCLTVNVWTKIYTPYTYPYPAGDDLVPEGSVTFILLPATLL